MIAMNNHTLKQSFMALCHTSWRGVLTHFLIQVMHSVRASLKIKCQLWAFMGVFCINLSGNAQPIAAWQPAAPAKSFEGQRMVELADGRILSTGGIVDGYTDSSDDGDVDLVYFHPGDNALRIVQTYDPIHNHWQLAAPMSDSRSLHTITFLLDGRVLVAGGLQGHYGFNSYIAQSAEVYDSQNNLWQQTPLMHYPRVGHTATRLQDGRVLVAGGYFYRDELVGNDEELSDAEIYDPQSNTWEAAKPLNHTLSGHTATLLNDGRVLVSGRVLGMEDDNWQPYASLYDPQTDTWIETPNPVIAATLSTLLSDGRVLAIDGGNGDAAIYQPADGRWVTVNPVPGEVGMNQVLLVLPDRRVLLIGGVSSSPEEKPLLTPYVFDEQTLQWSAEHALNLPQDADDESSTIGAIQNAVLLSSGVVFFSTDLCVAEGPGATLLKESYPRHYRPCMALTGIYQP